MSNSDDDDWFEKDIDEIVQEIHKKKLINSESSASTTNEPLLAERGPPKYFTYESDYGGGYDIPKHKERSSVVQKRQASKGEKGFIQGISFKKLGFISELSPLNTFLEVAQNDCGFFECLNQNLSNEYIVLSLKIFSKLCELPLDEFKIDFLHFFIQPDYLKQLEKFLSEIISETVVKNKKLLFHINITEITSDLIQILKNVVSFSIYENIEKFLENSLKLLENAESKFHGIKKMLIELKQKIEIDKIENRTKDIYPTLEELETCKLDELKPNIIKGKYDSIAQYLKIHLDLLREDFISPLRDSISEIRSHSDLDEIRNKMFYKKVRFLLNDVPCAKTRKGEMLLLDLKPDQRGSSDTQTPEHPTWINPRKLMFGSLLCLATSLNFHDLILAVVSHRDIETISKGYIQVEILKLYKIADIFEKDFIMIESEVYFEPYHHVHRVLRNLDETNFPMQNFIIDIDTEHHVPDYLKDRSKVPFYQHKKHSFNPLNFKSYPSKKGLKLDASQLDAYYHALSYKFTLIQGPPGTGKTYTGLEIVETLLENLEEQILIICYTNHALDQFLAGITNITTDIVRMGNQSKHELLDKYNIKQMSDPAISDRRLKSCFYNMKNEYLQRIQEFEKLQKSYDKTEESSKKIFEVQEKLRKNSRKIDELKQLTEYTFIKDKRVIGMTTTYAARCHLLLQLLKTPIVLIEEASEVLESHIIASLTKSTQQVILIGDHQQLRPTTSVYKLSQKYKMDISLFERMVNNNINCTCLSTQHRMRPENADLLRPNIYKNLQDNNNVREYENIKGLAKNMFFVKHDSKENKSNDETTKRNNFEAQYLIALANYLICQEYKPEDIVILTTYNGQMNQLLHERKQVQTLQKVRIAVVDNFQGEESKIILLSLVRSNDEDQIGYLSMINRICVALSRAREGFYVIGNMDFLARNSDIWKDIKDKLEIQENIGVALPLQCQRHGNITYIKSITDFKLVRYGGCQQRCDFLLPCGHTCGYMCHWGAFEHFTNCECTTNN